MVRTRLQESGSRLGDDCHHVHRVRILEPPFRTGHERRAVSLHRRPRVGDESPPAFDEGFQFGVGEGSLFERLVRVGSVSATRRQLVFPFAREFEQEFLFVRALDVRKRGRLCSSVRNDVCKAGKKCVRNAESVFQDKEPVLRRFGP